MLLKEQLIPTSKLFDIESFRNCDRFGINLEEITNMSFEIYEDENGQHHTDYKCDYTANITNEYTETYESLVKQSICWCTESALLKETAHIVEQAKDLIDLLHSDALKNFKQEEHAYTKLWIGQNLSEELNDYPLYEAVLDLQYELNEALANFITWWGSTGKTETLTWADTSKPSEPGVCYFDKRNLRNGTRSHMYATAELELSENWNLVKLNKQAARIFEIDGHVVHYGKTSTKFLEIFNGLISEHDAPKKEMIKNIFECASKLT